MKTRRNPAMLVLLIGLVSGLAGCESVSEAATDLYLPPAPGVGVAALRGTESREGGVFGSEHRGFVVMVDLKTIPAADEHWNEPVLLAPGTHTIVAEYRYSNFMTRAYLPLAARAGVTYQLMLDHGHESTEDGRLYAEFWIVDSATGKAVTPTYHRQFSGGKKGTIFYMNK